MKCITRIFAWAMVISSIVLASSQTRFRVDPTDDFSFVLADVSPALDAYDLMSEKDVQSILVDHLDLFPKSKTPDLARHVLRLARTYRFDPAFILSVVQVESNFRIKIASPAGAIGLMQLMPSTAETVAKRMGLRYKGAKSLLDPYTNLTIGVAYLAYLREQYRGDSPYYHVAAYNIGPARLNQLRAQKSFKPDGTKKYYLKIRDGVPRLRFYRAAAPDRELAGSAGA